MAVAFILCISALVAGAPAAWATSTPITLGTAANYGLLIGAGNTFGLQGGFNLAGNFGAGSNDTIARVGNNAISGTAYEGSSVTTNGSGTLAISGGVITQSMSQAISDAASASTNAAALTATAGLVDQGSSITSSVTIKALTNLSENVLDISSVNLSNGTITLNDNGYSGAKFIINVTGNFSLNNVTISATGGATAADIIFNIEGTGKTVSITGGTTLGTILVPASNVTVGGGGGLTGALIAGVNNAGTSYTVQDASTGYNITGFAYVPRAKVPEPSSLAVFGVGAAAVALIRRRRRRP